MYYLGSTLPLVTPGVKRQDCVCRGGRWIPGPTVGTEDVFGICVPGTPTGKHYSIEHRGCMPDAPDQGGADGKGAASQSEDKTWIWWAVGTAAAVVVIPLLAKALSKRKAG